jgi:1,4-alpha-glucan branching enzyme
MLTFLNEAKSQLQHGCFNPHQFLGLHRSGEQTKVVRLWRPGAEAVYLEVFGQIVQANQIDAAGLFECVVPLETTCSDYRIYHSDGLLAHDPYAFLPTFGEMDAYLFGRGLHYQLYRVLGARIATHQGAVGTKFAVWAPNAKQVAVVGDFNSWDGRVNPMRSMGASGVWELFIPGLAEGEKYKFEIKTEGDALLLKSDPYALSSEVRPSTASVVANVERFKWTDNKWIETRKNKQWQTAPMNIYEVHLGSWRRTNGQFWNYRELAHVLAEYCKEMRFSHVELMPVSEHPLDESWGYQVTGFYAVTSRFGTPEDFQYFVNHLHEQGIGVILDWVPAHFPMDDFSLARFDGSYLYEHADPKKGFHPHWNTYIFNYGRHEVCNFLIANALFWFDQMHIDGLRVDAVASMLYLDYGREAGEWIPNMYGGKENLEAIEFLKHLNSVVHERFPGVLMFAEESTAFTGVTHPLTWGGLGFDLKWNMGWMNDTLRYFHRDPLFRSHHQHDLTFGLLYAFTEKFILVLSHDEVVHGKKSLIAKMPGDDWQKFANARLLYTLMMCQPGKKLLFMGGELGQWSEWNCKEELHWFLLNYPHHQGLKRCVAEINALYHSQPPLFHYDFDGRGFDWIDFGDSKNCVISYLRKSEGKYLACVHHFTPNFLPEYFVGLSHVKRIKEVFNSDAESYGGSGKINPAIRLEKNGFFIQLSPLATLIFEVEFGD